MGFFCELAVLVVLALDFAEWVFGLGELAAFVVFVGLGFLVGFFADNPAELITGNF